MKATKTFTDYVKEGSPYDSFEGFKVLNRVLNPEDALRFVWSEVYKNDNALLAHLANPAVGVYLEAHAELGTDFSVEFYGTVGDKVIEAMKETGVPFKVFKTQFGYSRV